LKNKGSEIKDCGEEKERVERYAFFIGGTALSPFYVIFIILRTYFHQKHSFFS